MIWILNLSYLNLIFYLLVFLGLSRTLARGLVDQNLYIIIYIKPLLVNINNYDIIFKISIRVIIIYSTFLRECWRYYYGHWSPVQRNCRLSPDRHDRFPARLGRSKYKVITYSMDRNNKRNHYVENINILD